MQVQTSNEARTKDSEKREMRTEWRVRNIDSMMVMRGRGGEGRRGIGTVLAVRRAKNREQQKGEQWAHRLTAVVCQQLTEGKF